MRSNLISCLYLTRTKGLSMLAEGSCIRFSRSGTLLFTASVNSNHSATLDGVTSPSTEFVRAASTPKVDLSLLHRRLCHHNYADIKKMLSCDMVLGMKLDSPDKPDPICEA